MVRQRKSVNQRPISNISKESTRAQKRKRKIENEKEDEILRAHARKCFKFTKLKDPNATETTASSSSEIVTDPSKPDSPNSPQIEIALEECVEVENVVSLADKGEESSTASNGSPKDNLDNVDYLDPSTWPSVIPELLRKKLLSTEAKYQTRDIPILHFWERYVQGSKPNGELYTREWLRISTTSSSAFCLPCCFFRPLVSNKTCWSAFGSTGYREFNNALQGIRRHERGGTHLEAVRRWKHYVLNETNPASISSVASATYKEHIAQYKLILRGILDALFFLAQNNLPLLGRSHNIKDRNCGNFLSLISLLAKYYTPLNDHIKNHQKKCVTYLSPAIQNEFINLIGGRLKEKVLRKIRKRKYFAVEFDSTPDVSHTEQVSQIIRSVKCSRQGCEVQEHFIEFISTDEKTGQGLADVFVKKLKEDNLDLRNCRGQGYDNGPNMAGHISGVRACIENIVKEARFIPCAAHSLNLVGVNTAENISTAKSVLGTIQNLYVYFSSSTTRWTILKKHSGISLKYQSNTRWSSKHRAVLSLFENFKEVVAALEELSDAESFNSDTVAGAHGKLGEIMSFKTFLFSRNSNKLVCYIVSFDLLLRFSVKSGHVR